jgi:hypothetical protein
MKLSAWDFLHPFVTLILPDPDIFVSSLSQTLSNHIVSSERDLASQPYQTRDGIIVLFLSVLGRHG